MSKRCNCIAAYTVKAAIPTAKALGDELSQAEGGWTLGEYAEGLSFSLSGDECRILVPNDRPDGMIGMELVANDEFMVALIPGWFGSLEAKGGTDGCIISLNETQRISLRTYQQHLPRQIRIFGGGTPLDEGHTITLYSVY